MTIIPIFRWGLVAAAREGRLQGERSTFAGGLAIIVVGTFGAWYYWSDGQITSRTLGRVTDQALGWTSLFHFAICASFALRGAAAIAKERDRRTLDFLLATRLNNAEIVLGKLAACLLVGFGTLAAGLPVLLLLHVLGGVDLRLILLGLAGFASSVLFISSWAIWFSAEARSFRMAAAPFMLLVPLWMIGPFFVSMILPRLGYHLPEWAAAVNWWLLASSPVAVAFRMVLGLDSWTQLVFIVGRMIGIQLLGALLVTIVAIARLRAADRALASGDRSLLRRERRRPVWRLWSRPPVGDDPILWREMYTARGNGLMKAIGWLLNAGCLAVLAYATSCFAAPAVREAWEHGYPLAVSDVNRPEFNLFLRIFLPGAGPNQPIDLARIDFNLFLRYATTAMAVVLAVGGAATPGEVLDRERAKQTWTSLLATPMTGREILRATFLAAVWRFRELIALVLVLWTLGLIVGAVHPLGYLAALLNLAATLGFWMTYVTSRTLAAFPTKGASTATGQGIGLLMILIMSGALPFFLPAGLNSVLLGAGSLPLMLWLSLLSYRDVHALVQTSYPHLGWIGIHTGEGPGWLLAAWLLGTLVPALGGWWFWRSTLAQFDRWVGRPWQSATVGRRATAAHRNGPLAESRGSVGLRLDQTG